MTIWGIILYSVVLLWLMPGAFWRPVAVSLLLTWGFCEAVYAFTGVHVPRDLYYVCDAIVLFVIATQRSHWSDLLIIPLTVAQWRFYPEPVSRQTWFIMYWLALTQFIIAGPWPVLIKGMRHYSHGSVKKAALGHG